MHCGLTSTDSRVIHGSFRFSWNREAFTRDKRVRQRGERAPATCAAVPRVPVAGAPPSPLTPRRRRAARGAGARLHATTPHCQPVARQPLSATHVRTDSALNPPNHVVKWNCQTWYTLANRCTCIRAPHLLNTSTRGGFCVTKVVPTFWKIGLYERIMALARWAILDVVANTELVGWPARLWKNTILVILLKVSSTSFKKPHQHCRNTNKHLDKLLLVVITAVKSSTIYWIQWNECWMPLYRT